MLQITIFPIKNKLDAATLEESNHTGAFEYLPEAKGNSYEKLLQGEPAISCTFQILPSTSGDKREDELIKSGGYMWLLSATRRALIGLGTVTVVSMSYNEKLTENKNHKALIVNSVLKGIAAEDMESMLPELMTAIGDTLKIETSLPSLTKPQKIETFKSETNETPQETETKTKTETDPNMEENINALDAKNADSFHAEKMIDDNKRQEKGDFTIPNSSQTTEKESMESEAEASWKDFFSIRDESEEDLSATDENKTNNPPEENSYEIDTSTENAGNLGKEEVDSVKEKESEKTDSLPVKDPFIDKEADKEDFSAKAQPAHSDVIADKEEKFSELTLSELQEKLHKESSREKPFLNMISEYIPQSNLENIELFKEYKDVDADTETISSKEKIAILFERAMNYCYQNKRSDLAHAQDGSRNLAVFTEMLTQYIAHLDLPVEDREYFTDKMQRALFSYYVLEPLINDPDISDIKVLAPDKINVKIKGIHYSVTGLKFLNEDDYEMFVVGVMRRNHAKNINGISSFTDVKFCKDYILRFSISFPQLNVSGSPVLHIRKTEKEKLMLPDLIKAGMMDEKIANYLKDKLRTSRGIVFAGPSASGKSKCLNAMVEEIPYTDSGLVIQESDEIFAQNHPNIMCQHICYREDGSILIGMDKLGENGLICDIKYFIIGEIKGREARDFLRAANTGHICLCTTHTPSAEETIPRLADYVMRDATAKYTLEEAERLLKDLEVIVYISEFKIREISEVIGYDEKEHHLIYRTVYLRDAA